MDKRQDTISERLTDIKAVLDKLVQAINKSEDRQNQQSNEPVQVNTVIRQPEAIERKNTTDEHKAQRIQIAIAIAAWAAFAAALSYAVIAQLTLNDIHQQTAEVYRQAEVENANASGQNAQLFRQLNIARQQATAAERNIQAIQDQTKQYQRAWISVWGTTFLYVKDAQGVPRADSNITIKNTGLSPAFRIRVWDCGQVRDFPPVVGREPSSVPPCIVQDLGIIGPTIPATFEIPDITKPIAENSLPKTVFDKEPHFYVWGKITYRVVGESEEHFTSFCLLNGSPRSGMGPCSRGNDAN